MLKLQPINWKNVLIGVLIGLGVVLVISAVWFYFAGYVHIRETIRMEEEMKEWKLREGEY